MNSRIEARKDIMEDAHEGHEEYHSVVAPLSERPRNWPYKMSMSMSRFDALLNWYASERTLLGLVVTLVGLAVVMVLMFWLVGKYLGA